MGCPVIIDRADRPCSVSWYLAGFPKKSTLNSTKPREVSCLITQRVGHSDPSLKTSAISELAIPSVLFAMAAMADTRWGDTATFFRTLLCSFVSDGQTQTPLGMVVAD